MEQKQTSELEDTLLWIKKFLHTESLSVKEMEQTFSFLLMWNIFEGKLYDNDHRLTVETLADLGRAQVCSFDKKKICSVYDYFFDRYFGSKGDKDKFLNLRLEKDPKRTKKYLNDKTEQDFVKFILNNKESAVSEKLVAIFLIAYRFRNNLFHGLKNIKNLLEYQVAFTQINSLLREICESCPEGWRRR